MKNPTQHLITEVPRRQLQGGDDDRDRPWGCLEPLLHAQRRWRSSGPGPVSYQSIGSREVVYRSASGADRDGSGHALDLDQRATSGTGSRSDRSEREGAACDLAQRSEERQVDAEKLARYARLDPKILRPIAHRTVAQQEALTLIRARNLIVRLRTAAVNAVRGLAKPCGYRSAGLVHALLRKAECGRASAKSGPGARSGARTDRGDDEEDQALRSGSSNDSRRRSIQRHKR